MKIQHTLSFLILGTSFSLGATFYPILGVTSDTSATDEPGYIAGNLIQGPGVGFDASAPHDQLGAGGASFAWVTNAPNGGLGDYFAPTPNPGPRLVFDLGSSVSLSEISLWGYSDSNVNGISSMDLRFSDTSTFSGTPISISGIIRPYAPRQSFSFAEVSARYVELVPTDNLFGTGPGGDRVGIGEVAFAIPVPEPSTTALSFIALAVLARRRR